MAVRVQDNLSRWKKLAAGDTAGANAAVPDEGMFAQGSAAADGTDAEGVTVPVPPPSAGSTGMGNGDSDKTPRSTSEELRVDS